MIAFSSVSKQYGPQLLFVEASFQLNPGDKVGHVGPNGWIATRNRAIYNKMAALKDYTTICNSAPSEFLAEVAMRNRQTIAVLNLGIIQQNLSVMDAFFSRHAGLFSWMRPRACSMAFPRYLGGDVEQFCDTLVKRDRCSSFARSDV